MTEAAAKAQLELRRREARRYAKLRNLYRRLVVRSAQRLRDIQRRLRKRVRFEGNVVVGGSSLEEQVAYYADHAPAVFRLEYSESGSFYSEAWAVHNVPNYGFRTDCSSCARTAIVDTFKLKLAFPDPAGGFFTGSAVDQGAEVDAAYASSHPLTAVVYGDGTGFHMGLSLGDGSELTFEHGTADLDIGHFQEFGPGTTVRFYKLVA